MPVRRAAAFTLLELLLVLAVVGVLIGVAMPRSEPTLNEQIRAAGRIIAVELAYARSLAVSNNSQYRITFDVRDNRCVLEHSGTNAALNVLPRTAFHGLGDSPTQYVVDLAELPTLGMPVRLYGAAYGTTSLQYTTTVEFGPMGETTRSSPTMVWLTNGRSDGARYIGLTIDPVTGLVEVGHPTSQSPPVTVPLGEATAITN